MDEIIKLNQQIQNLTKNPAMELVKGMQVMNQRTALSNNSLIGISKSIQRSIPQKSLCPFNLEAQINTRDIVESFTGTFKPLLRQLQATSNMAFNNQITEYLNRFSGEYSQSISECFKKEPISFAEEINIADDYVDVSNDILDCLDSIADIPCEDISPSPATENFKRISKNIFLVLILPTLISFVVSYCFHKIQDKDSNEKHIEITQTLYDEKELLLKIYSSIEINETDINDLNKNVDIEYRK